MPLLVHIPLRGVSRPEPAGCGKQAIFTSAGAEATSERAKYKQTRFIQDSPNNEFDSRDWCLVVPCQPAKAERWRPKKYGGYCAALTAKRIPEEAISRVVTEDRVGSIPIAVLLPTNHGARL